MAQTNATRSGRILIRMAKTVQRTLAIGEPPFPDDDYSSFCRVVGGVTELMVQAHQEPAERRGDYWVRFQHMLSPERLNHEDLEAAARWLQEYQERSLRRPGWFIR